VVPRAVGSEGDAASGRRSELILCEYTYVYVNVIKPRFVSGIKDCRFVGKPNTRVELDFKSPGPRSTGFEERRQ
jgi:hypothetical protein